MANNNPFTSLQTSGQKIFLIPKPGLNSEAKEKTAIFSMPRQDKKLSENSKFGALPSKKTESSLFSGDPGKADDPGIANDKKIQSHHHKQDHHKKNISPQRVDSNLPQTFGGFSTSNTPQGSLPQTFSGFSTSNTPQGSIFGSKNQSTTLSNPKTSNLFSKQKKEEPTNENPFKKMFETTSQNKSNTLFGNSAASGFNFGNSKVDPKPSMFQNSKKQSNSASIFQMHSDQPRITVKKEEKKIEQPSIAFQEKTIKPSTFFFPKPTQPNPTLKKQQPSQLNLLGKKTQKISKNQDQNKEQNSLKYQEKENDNEIQLLRNFYAETEREEEKLQKLKKKNEETKNLILEYFKKNQKPVELLPSPAIFEQKIKAKIKKLQVENESLRNKKKQLNVEFEAIFRQIQHFQQNFMPVELQKMVIPVLKVSMETDECLRYFYEDTIGTFAPDQEYRELYKKIRQIQKNITTKSQQLDELATKSGQLQNEHGAVKKQLQKINMGVVNIFAIEDDMGDEDKEKTEQFKEEYAKLSTERAQLRKKYDIIKQKYKKLQTSEKSKNNRGSSAISMIY